MSKGGWQHLGLLGVQKETTSGMLGGNGLNTGEPVDDEGGTPGGFLSPQVRRNVVP